jgi:hypothetical protein
LETTTGETAVVRRAARGRGGRDEVGEAMSAGYAYADEDADRVRKSVGVEARVRHDH